MSFMDEIKKIPPVTRFLCGSALAVTVPVMLEILPVYKVMFSTQLILQKFQIWRLHTAFFMGHRKDQPLSFLFDFFMLYQTSGEIERRSYHLRSSDMAWQTIWAFLGILVATYPIGPIGIYWRPMLVCIVYLYSSLAPEGATMSPFGLFTMSVKWWPYFLIAIDVILGGPGYALISISGAVVGHLWWWGVWGGTLGGQGVLTRYSQAPEWLRNMIGETPQTRPPTAGGAAEGLARGGIHVSAPRRTLNNPPDPTATTGHRWGSGNRLGES